MSCKCDICGTELFPENADAYTKISKGYLCGTCVQETKRMFTVYPQAIEKILCEYFDAEDVLLLKGREREDYIFATIIPKQ